MKRLYLTLLIVLGGLLLVLFSGGDSPVVNRISSQDRVENRCGWFINPTPSNAWLIDRDAEWTISIQGGYQAEGDWPDIPASQWIKTNVHYGYGCACMRVIVNKADETILKIKSSNPRPLSACRKDRFLKKKEPK